MSNSATQFSTIDQLRDEMLEISSGWNGKDSRFSVGGIAYEEEHASIADDIIKKCNELEELINEFNEH